MPATENVAVVVLVVVGAVVVVAVVAVVAAAHSSSWGVGCLQKAKLLGFPSYLGAGSILDHFISGHLKAPPNGVSNDQAPQIARNDLGLPNGQKWSGGFLARQRQRPK